MSGKEKYIIKTRTKTTKKLDVPEEELENYRAAFMNITKKGHDTITAKDIYKYMKGLGSPITMKEIQERVKQMDTSGDGEIDFDEFTHILQQIVIEERERIIEKEPEDNEDEIIKAFKFFDKENTGKISKQEFRYIITKIGANTFSDSECDIMFKESEFDDNEDFDYREFVKFWREK